MNVDLAWLRGERASRSRVLLAGVLLFALAMLVGQRAFPAAEGDGGGPSEEPRQGATRPEAPKSLPVLSSSDRDDALELLATDPVLRDLVGDRTYSTEEVTLWHSSTGEQLGAAVILTLESPLAGEREWQYAVVDGVEDTPTRYETVRQRASADGVQTLLAFVDLRNSEVVEIGPITQ